MGIFDKPEELGRVDTHRLDTLEARVQQLELTVAMLTQQTDVARPGVAQPVVGGLSADVLARVQGLKREGNVIHAIKVYREATGVGLKEAKDAVERM